jgi:hypothetical protein
MRHTMTLLAAACAAAPLAAQWGPIATIATPSERKGAMLSYDLFAGRMLMFGGNWTNEFWSLQNGTWTQLQPGAMPSARMNSALATDTLNGTVLLYGGNDGARIASDETWSWNGTAWTLLSPNMTPGGLAKHAMAYDIARQRTVLFGGIHDLWATQNLSSATFEFDGTTWSAASPIQPPTARTGSTLAYHPGIAQIVMFGGDDSNSASMDDTWIFDGTDWNQQNPLLPHPAARSGASMVSVLNHGTCVLFGGIDATTMAIHNDTWDFDGANWKQVQNVYGGIYPPRREFALAHDVQRDRLVAFGGSIANGSLQDDTWEYGAQFQRFGNGCPGSAGVPSLTGVTLPQLGLPCSAQLTNLAPSSTLAVIAVGLSRTQWAFGSLPALLTNYGMPGCRGYTSADAFTFITANGGSATWTWNVPAIPGFVGLALHLQGLSIDPSANAAGLTVSNATTIVVGI